MLPLVRKPSELLHEAVAAIREGEVSEKARACGLSRAYFGRIRMKPVDVGIDTFAGICAGLRRSADDLMGLKPPDPFVDEVTELRLALSDERAANAKLRKALSLLADLPDAPSVGSRTRRRRASGKE